MSPEQTPEAPRRRPDWFSLLLVVMLAGACVEIVVLARQNRALKQQAGHSTSSASASAVEGPAPGTTATPISAVDPAGQAVQVEFGKDQRTTVLCVFTTSCPACQATLPIWKETLGGADPSRVRALAITQEDAAVGETHIRKAGLELPVLHVPQDVLLRDYRMGVVPLTIVIGPDGQVARTYPGVLQGDDLSDFRRRIGT